MYMYSSFESEGWITGSTDNPESKTPESNPETPSGSIKEFLDTRYSETEIQGLETGPFNMAPLAGIDQVAEALGEEQANAAEAIAKVCDKYLSKEIKSAEAAQKIDEIIDDALE